MPKEPKPKEPRARQTNRGGRPTTDLNPHRDFIAECLQDHWRLGQILERLAQEHDLVISKRILQRNIAKWNLCMRPKSRITDALKARVTTLYECKIQDATMSDILLNEGYIISVRGLMRLRGVMGLFKHDKAAREQAYGNSGTPDEHTRRQEQATELSMQDDQAARHEMLVDPALTGHQQEDDLNPAVRPFYEHTPPLDEYDEYTPPRDLYTAPRDSSTHETSPPEDEAQIDLMLMDERAQHWEAPAESPPLNEQYQQEEGSIYPPTFDTAPSPNSNKSLDGGTSNVQRVSELEQIIREKDQAIERMTVERERLRWMLAMAHSQLTSTHTNG